ncbi:MAG: SDR family NAD(P)-dependent oxidoreductase [Taibaiella sp.]|nr:SDR family NAD(P)-dependent oxidoreductase [Taibaiella sp.]
MWTANEIPHQKGKTVVVTGGNAGIGYETALALYKAGANVIVACRDKDKAGKAIAKMENEKGPGSLAVGIIDLASLTSVRQFAETFIEQHKQLHLLINNAGVATPPASKTSEGYELQFGVNFLGHFALTGYLYPLLQATQGSRIVTLSSNGYQSAAIDFENLKSEKDYNPLREYRQSKLANLIFSIELHRRIKANGHQVLSIAAQPGANNTDLTRHLTAEEIAIGKERLGAFMEPWQGALTSLYAAVSKEATGGNMYEPDDSGLRGYPTLATIQDNALDEKVAKKLWDTAQAITGVVYLTPNP